MRSALCVVILAMGVAASQCTANNSDLKTVGNSVRNKGGSGGGAGGGLPSGNSGISNIFLLYPYLACRKNGGCGATEGGSGLNSHPVGNSANTQMSQTSHANPDAPAQTTPVTTIITTNGELHNVDVSGSARRGTPGSSDSPPTVHGDGGHVTDPSRSVPAALDPPPVSVDLLPNSDDKDSAGHVNDVEGHDADAGGNIKSTGDKKSSDREDSGDLLSHRSEDGSGVIPATTTPTTKPITRDANKETPTRSAASGSSGSQALSPILQNPTSQKTPEAKLTRVHTTAAAKPEEKDTTQLQTLKSTTSTAAPTDSKESLATSTSEFTKGESTASPTSFPKLSKVLQSLDMKDSSIGSSAFFALAALATFFVMAVAPA